MVTYIAEPCANCDLERENPIADRLHRRKMEKIACKKIKLREKEAA